MQSLRRRRLLHENTVDPVLDLHFSFKGFDVNVAGPRLDGFEDDQVHQVHERGLTSQFVQLRGREFAIARFFVGSLFGRREVVEHPGHIAAVELQHGLLKLDRVGEVALHQTARNQPQILHHLGLERIGHGHRQPAVFPPQRQDVVLAHQFGRHETGDLAANRYRREVDPFDPGLDGKRLIQLRGRDIAQFEQNLPQLPVLDLLFGQGHAQRSLVQVRLFAQ